MYMRTIFLTLSSALVMLSTKANNVAVSNVTTSGQDVTAGANNAANFTYIEFDLNWDNSWRIGAGATNWDAVWVFAKFKIETGGACTAGSTWYHCSLSPTDGHHSITTNNGTAGTINTGLNVAGTYGNGVFLYRSANGNGAINWDDIKLRWRYRNDGLFDDCKVTVQVFAIEMVYVPQASFYVGDGAVASLVGQFESGTTSAALQITSEGALTCGGGGAGSLGNNNASGQAATTDDFNDATSKALPAAFPKGYNDYYCMKYEVTQYQYVEFLNTLDGTQQAARGGTATAATYFPAGAGAPVTRVGVKCKNAPVGAVPGEYGCDYDDDDTYNETDVDGMYWALSYLSTIDLLAYLDWACLRPMTELEFEKSCRGTLAAVAGEYPWGTTTGTLAAAVSNIGSYQELVTTASANYNGTGLGGPTRGGVFATGVSTRITSGASYYGIMELGGNVWEEVVTVGTAAGRSFTGVHGNGAINSAGAADVDFWPGINGNSTTTSANAVYGGVTGCTGYAGISFAGGTWNSSTTWLRVSDRQYRGQWTSANTRDQRNGGRGVRTAP